MDEEGEGAGEGYLQFAFQGGWIVVVCGRERDILLSCQGGESRCSSVQENRAVCLGETENVGEKEDPRHDSQEPLIPAPAGGRSEIAADYRAQSRAHESSDGVDVASEA